MTLTQDELNERLSWNLDQKIDHSLGAIEQFYNEMNGKIYVSFSGGKDSTVLLHLVRRIYPDAIAVFVNTGKEFPEIQQFVKTIPNVIWVRPKMNFSQVVDKYGFPYPSKEVAQKIHEIRTTKSEKLYNKRMFGDANGNGKISEKWKRLINTDFLYSNQCCNKLKKQPVKTYEKLSGNHPIVGTMVSESRLRNTQYLKTGCNILEGTRPMGKPISIWSEDDIWGYIHRFNIPYSDIYNKGYERTGCYDCMFGCNMDKGETRFQRLALTHPVLWKHSMYKDGVAAVLKQEGVDYIPDGYKFVPGRISNYWILTNGDNDLVTLKDFSKDKL